MISTKGRYALRMLTDLAQHTEEGYLSLKEIAVRQEISLKYLESIAAVLTRGGLLESRRGKDGGYRLARPAAEIRIDRVLALTETSLSPVSCLKADDGCPRAAACPARPLWRELERVIRRYLSAVTVADLAGGTVPPGDEY